MKVKKLNKTFDIGQFKTVTLFGLAGWISTYATNVLAICPIVVSSNSSMPVDDWGEAGCTIIINSGVTLSTSYSEGVTINGNSSSILNSGTVSSLDAPSIWIRPGGVASINNSGTISATGSSAIYNQGSLSALNNNGSITSSSTYAVVNDSSSTMTNFINTGTISTAGSVYSGVINSPGATIASFTNSGAIVGGASGWGVRSEGTITTFNNGQGGNNAGATTTALKYYWKLPTNYNIIVASPTHYGQLAVTSPQGTTTFGIYSGGVTGVAASTLTAGTYSAVLSGVTVGNLTGSTSGTYGSYNWSLNNVSGTTWNLVVTSPDSGGGGSGSSKTPTTFTVTGVVNVASIPPGATVILNGGILMGSGTISQPVTVNSMTIIGSGAQINITGPITGSGNLSIASGSTVTITAPVTLPGGLDISSGAVVTSNGSISGPITVSSGAVLKGSGVFPNSVNVFGGRFTPGHSPGYMNLQANLTLNNSSIYQQNIAGLSQANASTPIGLTGYYSFVQVDGQTIIGSGASLQPALLNLFSTDETSYGSAPYVPKLGDQFRMLTSSGGITGRFSSLIQPEGMAAGTQFVSFYNMNNSNSIDLAVVPTSYPTTIASASGNKNAQSVGSVLDHLVQANLSATSTTAQDQLLYAISGQATPSSIASYAQSLAGEVYPAAVSVIAQTTKRIQQAVLTRLGDTMGIGLPGGITNPAGNAALISNSNTLMSGGAPSATVSSNPSVNPNTEFSSLSNGNVWGELAYQKGNRSSDSYSGGWNSNLYQLVFGSDFYASNGIRIGGGLALSNTTLSPTYGSGTIQQGSFFAYGKMPVQEYVVDAMASIGLNSSDLSRGDITNLSNGFRNQSILGNDAMVSLGVSRPIDIEQVRVTPFARVTWQVVTQSGVNEGDAASALSVNRFTGNGVRGVLGVAAGSKETNPMTEKYTYRAYVGVGADSSGVLNPTLNASLAGMGTTITTPNAGAAFVQAGLYGTVKVSDNSYAYAGLSGEARTGQTLGAVNVGFRVQF